ncbi:MAG: hypothetical protein LBK99_10900 [Opitutaceae bacterium]|jgi:hypothetical protein|nr:hypothetical protein [Opitutaceae bacterium]
MAITEIATAITAARHALDLTKTIRDIAKNAEINQVVIDLQATILELQSQVMAMQSKMQETTQVKEEIEKKLVAYENWEQEAQRYELKEIASGIFVYALRPEHQGNTPAHWLCPCCFMKSKKSILYKQAVNRRSYHCNECKFETTPTPPPSPAEIMRPRRHGFY